MAGQRAYPFATTGESHVASSWKSTISPYKIEQQKKIFVWSKSINNDMTLFAYFTVHRYPLFFVMESLLVTCLTTVLYPSFFFFFFFLFHLRRSPVALCSAPTGPMLGRAKWTWSPQMAWSTRNTPSNHNAKRTHRLYIPSLLLVWIFGCF